jgi:transposase
MNKGKREMTQIIGIDVSKAKLDCLWLRDQTSRKVKTKVLGNDVQGHKALAAWLTKTTGCSPADIAVVMEATGVYHESVALRLFEQGFQVCVINPAQIKSYGESLGNTHKTDKRDSYVIALFGATHKLVPWQPEPEHIRELKALIARLEALDVDYRRESNRLEKSEFNQVSATVIESIHLMLKEIEKEKQRIENQIDDHIDRHPQLKTDKKLLESIPGVGPVMSRLMLSVLHSRDFRNAKQVAAYLGVIPKLVESGVFKGRSALTKKGPPKVRAKLYMAAVAATQWNPDIRAMRHRLIQNGKNKMQALGAAMRKLVHLCYGVVATQTEYSPQVC